ncbi:phospholipase C/P1 nuclease [Trametes coccinea BRFM310]|uniref:Phospholipase C/P1 nuclease n=1 Tax=Trametes coccinea (strain BRFM310) TaxID=1353009 RepID=A0A1Y2J5V7_TRAC3|nr:phospholipase C/P1 nuclease [Trametes coccinea BRFM310]
MRTWPLSVALLSSCAALPAVHAWAAVGHEIIATIAQIHLPKPVLSLVCDILHPSLNLSDSPKDAAAPPCHLAPISTWADAIRTRPEYRYTAPMHYINSVDDAPPHSCQFPGPNGWMGRPTANILAALGNVTSVLRDYAKGERAVGDAEEALKFLVHWVGEMHQPLHLCGRDKGGNGVRVAWNGRVSNFHHVWDGLLIAQGVRLTPRNYTVPLSGSEGALVERHLRGAIYDPYIRRIMHEGLTDGGRFADESDAWLDCPAPSPDLQSSPSSQWTPRTPVGQALEHTLRALGVDIGLLAAPRLQALLDFNFSAALGLTTPAGTEKRWDDARMCPYAWARDVHALNCDAELPIWPHGLDAPGEHEGEESEVRGWHAVPYDVVEYGDESLMGGVVDVKQRETEEAMGLSEEGEDARTPRHPELLELDSPEYAGKLANRWVVERLLAMGGVRLAGVLTDILADVAGDVQT